jgi:hypothetical protein
MSLKLNSSGGGSVTIQEPTTASDFTLTLPAATGTVQVSGAAISGTTGSFSGDLSFNSGYGSAAVAYGCRAWVNFNGTGTVAIRGSGNVSSITDNGTGLYTANFAIAMPDSSFSTQICSSAAVTNLGGFNRIQGVATTSVSIGHYENGNLTDTDALTVAVFR